MLLLLLFYDKNGWQRNRKYLCVNFINPYRSNEIIIQKFIAHRAQAQIHVNAPKKTFNNFI